MPTISTQFDPFASIVHDDPGTTLIPVSSQFKTNSRGMFSISTTVLISRTNCSFTALRFSTVTFAVELPLFLTKFILLRSEFAHLLVKVIGPLFSARRFLSAFLTNSYSSCHSDGCIDHSTSFKHCLNVALYLSVQLFTE